MTLAPTAGLIREQLPNGVTLLVQRRSVSPAAAQVTLVRAGFLDEPDTLVGVSHVLEHMLFKGTALLAPGELAQQTKALGGALNAYTAYDRTVYYATMPARTAFEVGRLQADQVQRSVIDADELRSELGVIIQEAKRKLDSPDAVAGETLHRLLYAEHRLRRWRIGIEAELERLTRDDLFGYYRSRYRPDRTIVALVADIPAEEALAELRVQWGDWRGSSDLIDTGPVERSFPSNQVERIEREMTRAELVVGWRAPGTHHPDAAALELAAGVLSQGRGARLVRTLRDPGLVGGIGAGHYGTVDVGVFAAGGDLEARQLPVVIKELGAVVRSLAESGPESSELDRVRTGLRARYQRSFERYEARAIALATAEAEGDVTRLDRVETEWLSVTPDRMREAMQSHLTSAGLAGVVCLPHGSDAPFDAAMIASAMQSSKHVAPIPAETIATAPATGPRLVHPPIHGVHHLALDNLDILTARHDAVPQTVIAWYGAGPAAENAASAGQAALAVRSMMRGTLSRDTSQLAVAIESLGGSISPSITADVLGFSTTVLAEHAAKAVSLLAEVMMSPRFDPGIIAVEQRLLIDDARAVEDDMVRFPVQLMLGEAFGDAGYGAPIIGTATSLESFDAASVKQWHAQWLNQSRGTLVAVGPGDPVHLAESLADATGQWRVPASSATSAKPGILSPRTGLRIAQLERQQSALAMLFPGPARNAPERFVADLWSAIAGGLGGRLFESLRSKRSLAYTVIAAPWQRRAAGGLITYIAMAPERLDEAREAMLEELAAFRDTPPATYEVERAAAMLIGQEEIGRQTAGAWAGEIADAWLLGEGLHELEDPGASYRGITPEMVHELTAHSFADLTRAEGVIQAVARA